MNIITKYILLFDCVNSSFSDRCVRRRKELRKRRGCARFPFLSFFPPHISLSLSFSFFNRDEEDDERSSLSKSLCYRFPSGCATVCLPCTPSSRCLPPSRCILQRIRSFRRVRFFNSSRGGEKKGVGGEKKKGGRNRCNGWSDGWTEKRRQFFDPSSVHAHEGIQMQEVTHPVRSIYRSKDRALPFIRSILDTREL